MGAGSGWLRAELFVEGVVALLPSGRASDYCRSLPWVVFFICGFPERKLVYNVSLARVGLQSGVFCKSGWPLHSRSLHCASLREAMLRSG
jgi:hypothetical protein